MNLKAINTTEHPYFAVIYAII